MPRVLCAVHALSFSQVAAGKEVEEGEEKEEKEEEEEEEEVEVEVVVGEDEVT